MSSKLLKLTLTSLLRRKKEIVSAFVATLAATFFLAGVLIFQTDMYQWQMANNKQRFGDWFVIEFSGGEANAELAEHPYLKKPAQAATAAYIYDSAWNCTDYRVGYMTDAFVKQGNIVIDKGKMPELENEIAMDYNTLLTLGYAAEPGVTITLNTNTDTYGDESNQTTKEYVLSGVLKNYTNVWIKGKQCPAAVVSKSAFEKYQYTISNVYIYGLKDFVQSNNYANVYEGVAQIGGKNLFYNASVYDYKPWGPSFIYNYMYILIMVICVAAITYQLVEYHNGRQGNYIYMRRLGATKGQMYLIALLENFILLVTSATAGIIIAAVVGKIICLNIEKSKGIRFYYVDSTVYIKCLIALLLAAAIQEIIYIYNIKKIEKGKKIAACGIVQCVQKKHKRILKSNKINSKNINRIIRGRFIYSNGWYLNVGIRLFSFVMTMVIIICIWNTYTAYTAYQDNDALPDFITYPVNEDLDSKGYAVNVIMKRIIEEVPVNHTVSWYESLKSGKVDTPPLDEYMKTLDSITRTQWQIYNSAYCRNPDTALTEGIPESVLLDLQLVGGIQSIQYSYFESNRMWNWDGMDLDKMGMQRIMDYHREDSAMKNKNEYMDKYLFATEYVKPTREIYDRISKYIDVNLVDYEAFERGEQILVFLDENPDGVYDTTLKQGAKVKYIATPIPLYFLSRVQIKDTLKFSKLFEGITLSTNFDNVEYFVTSNDDKKFDGQKKWNVTKQLYQWDFEGRATPTAAGVVILDDSIREEFSDIIPKFGYYTALASENMAKNIMDSQTKLLSEMLQRDVSQEETPYQLGYNQMSIRFDLSSVYSSTNNILSSYFKQAGFEYTSFAEEKEQYRIQTINAMLLYGVTLFAAMLIDVIILIIAAKNKLEKRKGEYQLLRQLGADRQRIVKMWMFEALRESVWCMFTLPFVLMAQWLMTRKHI